MIALNDVNNELHVRLYILEVFKDYVRDDDFDELLDKALDFVMEGVSMPKVPVKDTTMSDISRSIIALTTGIGFDGINSLVAVCDEGSKRGIDKGSTDFVDVNERYVTNGFFYISVEDADKQSSYMGKNP